MRYQRAVLLLALVLLLSVTVTGCALPGTGDAEPAEPADSAAPPQDDGTPAVPSDTEAEIATADIGEPASAGAWTLVVREAEYDDAFGDLAVESGQLLKVEVDLTNSSGADLKVSPTDFMLSDGTAYTLPLETGPELTPERLIPAGKTEDVSAVFSIPEDRAEVPLTLIFQPAEGEPVSIRVTIR